LLLLLALDKEERLCDLLALARLLVRRLLRLDIETLDKMLPAFLTYA
jgi:hypothetical protein